MKTFDEIKHNTIEEFCQKLERNEKLEKEWYDKKGFLTEEENYAIKRNKERLILAIENPDETTIITIGNSVNSLIESIKKAYLSNMSMYYENFEAFCKDIIIGEEGYKGILPYGYGKGACEFLGIDIDDLLCLKSINPLDKNFGDTLRQKVNQFMGVNIPMSGVEEKAELEYQDAIKSEDSLAIDKAFVEMMEIKRDSGELMSGLIPNLLSQYEEYLSAKERISGRTIK